MRRFFTCLITMAFLFLAMNGRAFSLNYIINGDFETGDFTGWQLMSITGAGSWVINDGTATIIPLDLPLAPISGSYDAMALEMGPDMMMVYQQNVTLPSNITSVTLSWSDRILNYAEDFNSYAQGFAVAIFSSNNFAYPIWFFQTQPGDPLMQIGPNSRSFDLTSETQSLAGQEIMVAFMVLAGSYYHIVAIDNVSLDIETGCKTVGIDIKPGSEPNCINNNDHGVIPVAILGAADFDVTTIDAATVRLEGLSIKVAGKSNKLLAHYEDVNADGYQDLVVQIEDTDTVFAAGQTTATLTGNLSNGMCIEGSDSICIVP